MSDTTGWPQILNPGGAFGYSPTLPPVTGPYDRLDAFLAAADLNADEGNHVVDMSAATVTEHVGGSIAWEAPDAQGLGGVGQTMAPVLKANGIYVMSGTIIVGAGVLDVGAELTVFVSTENASTPKGKAVAEDAFPTVGRAQGTDHLTALVSWGEPPFDDDFAIFYRITGHVGAVAGALVDIRLIRVI